TEPSRAVCPRARRTDLCRSRSRFRARVIQTSINNRLGVAFDNPQEVKLLRVTKALKIQWLESEPETICLKIITVVEETTPGRLCRPVAPTMIRKTRPMILAPRRSCRRSCVRE